MKAKMVCYMLFLIGCAWIVFAYLGKVPEVSCALIPLLGGAGALIYFNALDNGKWS